MLTDDRPNSLEKLEGYSLGEPEFESGLVLRCHELWKKPLVEFTPGDLCILIGQRFSLPHLVPMALDLLEVDPLLDAEYYEGDLLTAVAQLYPSDFEEHPDWLERSKVIVIRAMDALKDEDDLDLTRPFNAFLARFE